MKKVSAIRLHKNFEIFFFKFLYDVVKAANQTFLGRLDKDNQLTGILSGCCSNIKKLEVWSEV